MKINWKQVEEKWKKMEKHLKKQTHTQTQPNRHNNNIKYTIAVVSLVQPIGIKNRASVNAPSNAIETNHKFISN